MSTVEGGGNIITDGLVLFIDAANNKSYPKTGTTINNLCLQETGSLINGVTYSENNAGYFTFDGIDDKIGFGTRISSLNLTYPFSFDLWINVNATGNTTTNRGIFSTSNTTALIRYYGVSIQLGNSYNGSGNYKVFINIGTGVSAGPNGRLSLITDDEVLIGNTWCHLVGTISSGPIFKIYVNAQEKSGTTSGTGVTLDWGTNTITEIGPANAYNSIFNGSIANVKFYNKLLSASEVIQNYNATKTRFRL